MEVIHGSPMRQALDRLARRAPADDVAAVETCLSLVRAAAEVYDYFDDYFGRFGVSQGRFLLLVLLWLNEDGLSPADLADQAGVSRATVTGLLDGLQRTDLIVREANPGDRRMLNVRLTRGGTELVKKVLPEHFRRMTDLLADLTREERRQLAALATKIVDRASVLL
ncbi:MAG TPA: MarR family transcriptional regulator [Bacillota bacterium]